jgi:hypothetical protein
MFQPAAKMNRIMPSVYVCAVAVLLKAVSGCTVILPESQNAPHNATKQVRSSGNVTVSIQALGERQHFSVSQFVSYSAKQGCKLTVYDVNITNLDGTRQTGNMTFFTLVASNGTVYQVVPNTLSPGVLVREKPFQGRSSLRCLKRPSLTSCVTTTETAT